MPNPIADPAASIPFIKAGLVFSALVAGSISPDLGYFISVPTPYFSHTAPGLILFDVPMGFVLLWLFHTLVKWPLLSLLPATLQRRLVGHAHRFSFGALKRFGLILLSLLVGSFTHLIWDSFTHENGWVVQRIVFLNISIVGTPLYGILQNMSTILGTGILIYWFFRWLPKAPQSDQLPEHFSGVTRNIFFALLILSLAVVEGAIIYSRVMKGSRFVLEHFLMDSTTVSAVIIISFFMSIYCLAWMTAFHKTIQRVH